MGLVAKYGNVGLSGKYGSEPFDFNEWLRNLREEEEAAGALPAHRTETMDSGANTLQRLVSNPLLRGGSALASLPGRLAKGAGAVSEIGHRFNPTDSLFWDPERRERVVAGEREMVETVAKPFLRMGESLEPLPPEGVLEEVAQGVGGALPDLAAIIAAGPAAPLVAGTLTAGQSLEEARARGVDDDEALIKAAMSGVGGALLEPLGARAVRGMVPGAGSLARRAAGKRALVGGIGESVTEGAQETLEVGLEQATGADLTFRQAGERILMGATVGGVLGGGLGVASRAAQMSPDEKAKAREFLKRELTVQGGLPDYAFEAVEKQDAEYSTWLVDGGWAARDLAAKMRGLTSEQPGGVADLNERVYRWLTSPEGERPAVPEEILPELAVMRKLQDDLSKAIYDEPELLTDDQKATFDENVGKYLRRSFAIHDNPRHLDEVRGTEHYTRARDLFAELLEDDGADPATAQQQAESQIERMLVRNSKDADVADPIAGSVLGEQDLTILKHRKNLEVPILKVLGEYTDQPTVAYLKSIERAARTLTTHKMYRAVRDGGLVAGDISPAGDYVPGHDFNLQELPAAQTKRAPIGRGEGDETLFTGRELYKALDAAMEQHNVNWYSKANGIIKWGLTVGSVQAQMRNVESNTMALVAGGNLFLPGRPGGKGPFSGIRGLARGMDIASTGLDMRGMKAVTEDVLGKRKLFREASSRGLIGKNADVGDVRHFLGQWGAEVSGDFTTLNRLRQLPQKGYQFGDDSFKMAAFWAETEKLRWAGFEDGVAMDRAAEIVKRTLQNYNRIPKVAKRLRQVPVIAPFVSFPTAVMINGKNQLTQAVAEIREGKEMGGAQGKKLATIGARRLGGMATAAMFTTGLAKMIEVAAGAAGAALPDDEEKLAAREFLPFYQENSQLAWIGKNQYVDLTFADYWGQFKRPLTALTRALADDDRDGVEAAMAMVKAGLEPYISPEPLTASLIDTWTNRTPYGSNVTNPTNPAAEQAADFAGYLISANMPGTFKTVSRNIKAWSGTADSKGKEYDRFAEAAAVAGPRITTIDVSQKLAGRGRWFRHGKSLASKTLNDMSTRLRGRVTDKELRDAGRIAHHQISEVYKGMSRGVAAARALGMSDESIDFHLGEFLKGQAVSGPRSSDERGAFLSGADPQPLADAWMRDHFAVLNEKREKERHLAERSWILDHPAATTTKREEALRHIRDLWQPLNLQNLYQ